MKRNSNRRGLQTMRTITSRRANPTQQRHEFYLKLTTLEMEKTRREIERDTLIHRLNIIEERLQQVFAEQEDLNRLLSGVEKPAAAPTSVGNPRQAKSEGAFPLQY